MAISQKVSVTTDRKTIAPVVYAVQGDTGRQIVAEYSDFQLAAGMTGVFAFTRSDGTSYSVPATIDPAANTATAEMDQALTQVGKTKGQIKITDSSGLGSTFTFYIDVQEDLSGTPTEQQYYDIQAAVEAAAEVKAEADQVLEDLGPISQINERLTDAEEELDNKADIDGTYPSLTAGLAEQLLSNNRVTDQTPYLYRQTALEKANATRALMRKIVGGSVVWNQLMRDIDGTAQVTNYVGTNGSISYSNNSIVFTALSGNYAKNFSQKATVSFNATVGHKYLYSCYLKISDLLSKVPVIAPMVGEIIYLSGFNANTDTLVQGIINPTSAGALRFYFYPWGTSASEATGGETATIHNVMIIDLTAMFGTTIADYIYSLEQATAGSGIAKLKEWGFFTKDYYDYDPGTMRSVEGLQAKETVGFNLWDEEWENGYYSRNNGAKAGNSDTSYYRSKNFIHCTPNASYYFGDPAIHANNNTYLGILYYDSSKTFISAGTSVGGVIRQTPSNAYYMTFYIAVGTSGSVYHNDFCVNLSDPQRNGTYEPYVKHTYPLDSTLTLRGIPKLVDNELVYDGDEYAADGTVRRRYALLTIAEENIDSVTKASTGVWTIKITVSQRAKSNSFNVVCSAGYQPTASAPRESGYIRLFGNSVFIYDNNIQDIDTAKSVLIGKQIVYELDTPTTETAEPYTEVQVVDKDGTEQFVTSGIVPVGHVTEYPEDLVGKIDELPDLPETAGSYVLRVTVTSGKASYEWVSA